MEESTNHTGISVNFFINIKCLAQPTCVINSGYYYTTFYSSAASVSACSAVLSTPKSVPPPAASLHSSLASTPLLHIQGQYFSNSSLDPLLHQWFFPFSTETVPSAYKNLLYCYFFHLGKKNRKQNHLLVILTSLPITNLFLCSPLQQNPWKSCLYSLSSILLLLFFLKLNPVNPLATPVHWNCSHQGHGSALLDLSSSEWTL